MANEYKIDTALHQAAIKQIEARLRSSTKPVSQTTERLFGCEIAAQVTASSKEMFSDAWFAAHRMQDGQDQHNAQPMLSLDMPSSFNALPPELRAKMEGRHAERVAAFGRDQQKRREMLNKHYREVLVGMFANLGVEKPTAEAIVDQFVINRV